MRLDLALSRLFEPSRLEYFAAPDRSFQAVRLVELVQTCCFVSLPHLLFPLRHQLLKLLVALRVHLVHEGLDLSLALDRGLEDILLK